MRRFIRHVLLPLALGYLLVVGLMAMMESALVFPAPRIPLAQLAQSSASIQAEELSVTTDDGVSLYGWRVGDHDRLVLYFSGNGSSVGEVGFYQFLDAAGWSTVHVNYRGYPGSAGQPSEMGLRHDARAAWREARRTHPADRILVIGRSLGGGVAMGLVAGMEDESPGGLVLVSTFTSVVDVASERFSWLPVRKIMKNRFDSIAVADQILCPTLVLHGDGDRMIDVSHGQRLADSISNAWFVKLAGKGHNDALVMDSESWGVLSGLFW